MPGSIYQVVLADSPESRRVHFHLRYQVFCCDTGFEPAENFPDGLERDDHDAHAVHFLVGRTGAPDDCPERWVGAMRLILADSEPLPIQTRCRLVEGRKPDAHARVAEVSRLIVKEEAPHPEPLVLFLLCSAALGYSQRHGLQDLYFLIRPALFRILRRQGLAIDLTGDPCEHRGLRYPCGIAVRDLVPGMEQWRQRLKSIDQIGVTPYVRHTRLTGRTAPEPLPAPALATVAM